MVIMMVMMVNIYHIPKGYNLLLMVLPYMAGIAGWWISQSIMMVNIV